MKVAIIGAGSMGSAHAAGWIASRSLGAELVGIVGNDPASTQKLADEYGVRAFARLDQVLSDVDIVDICAPTPLHLAFTEQAAAAGKHIICEKPIARSYADGQRMIALCEAAGVRLFVGMVVRFFPQYQSVQRALTAGQIGNLAVLRLTRASWRPQKAGNSWFFDVAQSGGPLLDMLVHDYDYARWLGGAVERVYACTSPADAHGISDYAQVMLRFQSGAIAHIEGGWCYPPGLFRTKIEAAGDGGLIEWESDQSAPFTAYYKAKPGEAAEVGLPLSPLAVDPYTATIQHFYTALTHDQPFSVTPQDALEATRIGLAAIESAQSGKPITLADFQG